MAAEPERDQVVQLVVRRGAAQAIREPAFDPIRDLTRWPHLGRIAALADRVVDRRLGDVGAPAPWTGARWWSSAAAGARISPQLSRVTSPRTQTVRGVVATILRPLPLLVPDVVAGRMHPNHAAVGIRVAHYGLGLAADHVVLLRLDAHPNGWRGDGAGPTIQPKACRRIRPGRG